MSTVQSKLCFEISLDLMGFGCEWLFPRPIQSLMFLFKSSGWCAETGSSSGRLLSCCILLITVATTEKIICLMVVRSCCDLEMNKHCSIETHFTHIITLTNNLNVVYILWVMPRLWGLNLRGESMLHKGTWPNIPKMQDTLTQNIMIEMSQCPCERGAG